MAKSLLYRFLGVGKIPRPLMAELESEGIVLLDEGVKGSVTYRDFHRPGSSSSYRKQWYTASIALTKTRLLGLWYANPTINVPLSDERIHSMRFSLEDNAAVLCVAFDASLFNADWSGAIEYRFRTPEAQRFFEMLQKPDGS